MPERHQNTYVFFFCWMRLSTRRLRCRSNPSFSLAHYWWRRYSDSFPMTLKVLCCLPATCSVEYSLHQYYQDHAAFKRLCRNAAVMVDGRASGRHLHHDRDRSEIRRPGSSSIPDDGWSNGPAHGLIEIAVWPRTSSEPSNPQLPDSMLPLPSSSSVASLVTHEIQDKLLERFAVRLHRTARSRLLVLRDFRAIR